MRNAHKRERTRASRHALTPPQAGTHLPQWLATPGMGADKIAAFYADPLKLAVDKASLNASMMGRRSAIDQGLYWRVRRIVGKLRRLIADARAEARVRLRCGQTEDEWR